MKQNIVLFIGLVWPEPTSSAAGIRILQLVKSFLDHGYEVVFSSGAQKTPFSFDFDSWNVKEFSINLNCTSFNEFIKNLQPQIVVYDRYVSEEQFGWRVVQECPNALQILDTEDLHFLRYARENSFKKKVEFSFYNEITKREIASIIRCDLSLIISKTEKDILINKFKIPSSLLYYLPFLEDLSDLNSKNLKSFKSRRDFVFIGNFLHEPNWQTVVNLKNHIWPKIRKVLPEVNLHIYGAYCSQKVFDFNNSSQGFIVHGKAMKAQKVISECRVLLAPIPFGAGQKGKFIDAMKVGTPIATSSIGAEGMFENHVPGIVSDEPSKFIQNSIELYCNEILWYRSQEIGIKILKEKFNKLNFEENFHLHLQNLLSDLMAHRIENFMGQILRQNTLNSLKYMSLWIQEKNKSL